MPVSRLQFRILGPLAVRIDGTAVSIGGPKQRALLALLLLSANRVVSRDRLIGELFVEQGVNSADHALRNHVSRLRKVLSPAGGGGEPRIVARSPGYLLRVSPGELDLEAFEQLAAAGSEARAAGDAASAAASLRSAAHRWQGQPWAALGVAPFPSAERGRRGGVKAERASGRVVVAGPLWREKATGAGVRSIASVA